MRLVPLPALAKDAHKGDAGRVLAFVGCTTMPGAAVLVARAAQRTGAGLVAIGCMDANLLVVVPGAAPEAVLVDCTSAFGPDGRPRESAQVLLRARDPHAILCGPGLGDTARTRALTALVLADSGRAPLVLDADALNALEGRPERLRQRAGPVVITPHPGEASRLLGRAVARDAAGRLSAASELARRSGAVVVLKGHGTVIADGERTHVNGTGNPGLATAGVGDVLAGVLVAYLAAARAAGIDESGAFELSCSAVHVHGLAGDLAAKESGARGVVASDLIDFLPAAVRKAFGRRGSRT